MTKVQEFMSKKAEARFYVEKMSSSNLLGFIHHVINVQNDMLDKGHFFDLDSDEQAAVILQTATVIFLAEKYDIVAYYALDRLYTAQYLAFVKGKGKEDTMVQRLLTEAASNPVSFDRLIHSLEEEVAYVS